MRLPNGFGSVTKLSGKRRRPWMVRKTLGFDEDTGKQICQILGYYATRSEALSALAEYNASPYDLTVHRFTFSEVYDKWSARKYETISSSNVNGYKAAYKACTPLYKMPFADIRVAHLQNLMDHCGKGYQTRRKIKNLFGQLYDYAVIHEITEKDYSSFVDIGKPDEEKKTPRVPFSADEIRLLWDNAERMDFIDTVLIMIYTGLRIGELLEIRTADVHLDERYMTGGLKTEAGKNRVIPISRRIEPFIRARLQAGGEYLITNHLGQQMSYNNYYDEKWKKIMEQLQLSSHRPHDCRHTFASLMDSAGANKLCIKRIMGHASTDITDKVYTHKDIAELIAAVDLI